MEALLPVRSLLHTLVHITPDCNLVEWREAFPVPSMAPQCLKAKKPDLLNCCSGHLY